MRDPSHLEIIPLGGLGEFGMNLMVYRWGDACIVVDAGMMFPGAEHLGVDVVIPDLDFLDSCGEIHGLILTHGHEDHIGAVPFLLARHDIPVYATPYTANLVAHRLREHGLPDRGRVRPLPADSALTLGPFEIETLHAAHSIPQARMIVLRTPVGLVVHTADFKLEPDCPEGGGTDLARLAELGREGVLLLLSDSTNADRPGFTPGERTVAAAFDDLLGRRRGRVVVTTFASNVRRIAQLSALATRHGRRVCVVGQSLRVHTEIAARCGLLDWSGNSPVAVERAMELAPRKLLVLAGGSQGEPLSSMARIAVGKHREIGLEPGDLVVHSARSIPGNEKSIARMFNHCLRRGAELLSAGDAAVHVSGHAASDELRLLLHLLRPRFMVPIHGEYMQLQAHARLARDSGLDASAVQLADSGDVIAVNDRGIEIGDRVHVGQVFIDATRDEVDRSVLRDRRRIAGDGIVMPVVAVHRDTGAVNGYPEIVTRGFVLDGDASQPGLLQDAQRAVADSLAEASPEERSDEGLLRARIQGELKRFLRRRTQRRPLVIPVVLEL